jgi:hypothetical protein
MSLSRIGTSNVILTDGTAPGAITPHASTANGDLLVFFHYSRAAGGDETVTVPSGFTEIFNSVTAGNGLLTAAYRVKQAGDTTFTATVTNHATGVSGETIIEYILTLRGQHLTTPAGSFTAAMSTWASSLNIGPVSPPADTALPNEDWVFVFGGRFEEMSGMTLLSGDNLTWDGTSLLASHNGGADASFAVQIGKNLSGSTQTMTAKTITTTGTAQVGGGRMFVIRADVPSTFVPRVMAYVG